MHDELLVVGTLHTQDPLRPRVQAALIRGGRFAAVGTREECESRASGSVRFIELGKGSATPGLIDAHGHVRFFGRSLSEVSCAGAASEAECAARAARAASGSPPGTWIRGVGWKQDEWRERKLPTSASLSAAVPNHPVALARADSHALWVNELALQRAGIGRETNDPDGGLIVRDAEGNPTGVLVDNAMRMVFRAMPRAAPADIEALLLRGLKALAVVGLTAVHDAGVDRDTLEVYRKLAEERRLPLRVYAMLDGQQPLEKLTEQMDVWRRTPEVGRLTVRAVKMFADGALGSRGAKLFEPYSDDPGNTGLWLTEPGELRRRVQAIAAAGFQPCIHAIGDAACAEVLASYASLPRVRPLRPRIEHLQLLRARDVPLLRASGAVASMQPVHATSDALWAEARLGRGTERQKGAYAWRQALDAGATLAFGSDFPIESIDPRLGLRSAVARRAANGQPWMPEQRLTRDEALRAFTADAAYAEHAEDRRGMIREGYDADLTVFDRDVLEVAVDELPDVGIAATVVGGVVEYAGP
ncbi:MAG TPA: amidohydrolase [Myxococcales bacterium]|nr:amidohydrolase [Myxococcales bacterium]